MALAVPDSVKMESTIAYPERNIMECTLVVIVFSVNAGKVINTRRKVVEAWGGGTALYGLYRYVPL